MNSNDNTKKKSNNSNNSKSERGQVHLFSRSSSTGTNVALCSLECHGCAYDKVTNATLKDSRRRHLGLLQIIGKGLPPRYVDMLSFSCFLLRS